MVWEVGRRGADLGHSGFKVELTGSTCDWWNMGIQRKKKSQRTPGSGSEIGNVRGKAVWGWESEGMKVTEITSLVLESLNSLIIG